MNVYKLGSWAVLVVLCLGSGYFVGFAQGYADAAKMIERSQGVIRRAGPAPAPGVARTEPELADVEVDRGGTR